MEQDIMDALIRNAHTKHDGHMSILKFTTNWRVGFVTPNDRDDIDAMSCGSTFVEAALAALIADGPPRNNKNDLIPLVAGEIFRGLFLFESADGEPMVDAKTGKRVTDDLYLQHPSTQRMYETAAIVVLAALGLKEAA